VFEAVLEDLLAVANRVRICEAREEAPPRDLAQEFVTAGHRAEERAELEILAQRVGVGGQRLLEIEVALAVHEEDLHRGTRFASAS
jgi:hypothetical protein